MGIILSAWKTNRKAVGVFVIAALTLSWKIGWITGEQALMAGSVVGLLTGVRMLDKKS